MDGPSVGRQSRERQRRLRLRNRTYSAGGIHARDLRRLTFGAERARRRDQGVAARRRDQGAAALGENHQLPRFPHPPVPPHPGVPTNRGPPQAGLVGGGGGGGDSSEDDDGAWDDINDEMSGAENHLMSGAENHLMSGEETNSDDTELNSEDGDKWSFDLQALYSGDDEKACKKIGNFIVKHSSSGGMTKKVAQEVYEFLFEMAEDAGRMKMRKTFPRTAKAAMRRANKVLQIPPISTDVYMRGEGGEVQKVATVAVLSKDLQKKNVAKRVTSVPLMEAIKFICQQHGIDHEKPPPEWRELTISSDGLESKARGSSWSFHILSISLGPCGTVYPIVIQQINKKRGGEVTLQTLLDPVVLPLQQTENVVLKWYLGDGKERKWIKGMKATNSYYGCETCIQRGTQVDGQKRVSYPLEASKPPKRTMGNYRAMNLRGRLSRLAKAKKVNVKGLSRMSPLLKLRRFNLIWQSPPDEMHLMALGLSKKIYELIFTTNKRPGQKVRLTRNKRKRVSAIRERLDNILDDLKVPSEHGRRPRAVESKYKGVEWRLLGLFLYPVLAILAKEETVRRRKILALFGFMYRALCISQPELLRMERDGKVLERCMRTLAELYQEEFGPGELTFNGKATFIIPPPSHAYHTKSPVVFTPFGGYTCFKELFTPQKTTSSSFSIHFFHYLLQNILLLSTL